MRPLTILLTGFGPFPGAPINPTGELILRLATQRRHSGVRIVTYVFKTSYMAVDRDLPELIRRHRPGLLLMFGLALRSRHVRIETRARNALSAHRDAANTTPRARSIVPGAPDRMMDVPAYRLLAAARGHTPVRLSRDAGRYLCNYLCWRAIEAKDGAEGLRLIAFVHVPKIDLTARPKRRRGVIAMQNLVDTGGAILTALIAARPR